MSDEPPKAADASTPFTAQEAMAFMQKMWNPFGMPNPGMAPVAAQSGETPPNTATTASAAAASAAPMPGMMGGAMPGLMPFPNPAAMFAALDPVAVERKIADLKVIEGWLAMSLNLMQMSIKTLELQHASLQALQAAHAPARQKEPRHKPRKT